ncbi:MAG: hypothetical protein ACLUNO_09200 [Oscillospiraceae bacterium]
MAEKPKTNVDKFFEIYDADPALQARVQQAMDSYPGSLEIRDVMTEHVLLPVAEELGLPFTLKELRNYELLKWGRQHQDRELTERGHGGRLRDDLLAARSRLVERRGRLLRRRALRYAKRRAPAGARLCHIQIFFTAGCGCPPHRASRSE